MPILHSTLFLHKADTIKASAKHLENCESFAICLVLDDPKSPAPATRIDIHADSLEQLDDLGYAIVNAVNALKPEEAMAEAEAIGYKPD